MIIFIRKWSQVELPSLKQIRRNDLDESSKFLVKDRDSRHETVHQSGRDDYFPYAHKLLRHIFPRKFNYECVTPVTKFSPFRDKVSSRTQIFGLCSIHNRSIIGIFVIYWKLESGAGTDYRLSPIYWQIYYFSKTIVNSSLQRFDSMKIFKSAESIFSIFIR